MKKIAAGLVLIAFIFLMGVSYAGYCGNGTTDSTCTCSSGEVKEDFYPVCPVNTACPTVMQYRCVPKCVESDNGQDIYLKGITVGYENANSIDIVSKTDSCYDRPSFSANIPVKTCSGSQCYLNEYYCQNNRIAYTYENPCSAGCSNGACVSSTNTTNITSTYSISLDPIGGGPGAIVAGTSDVLLAKFRFKALSGSVKIVQVSVKSNYPDNIQNIKLSKGSTQIGNTLPVLTNLDASGKWASFTFPETIITDDLFFVYADVNSDASGYVNIGIVGVAYNSNPPPTLVGTMPFGNTHTILPSSTVCTDTDGGKIYDVKGTVTAGVNIMTDACKDNFDLWENYCVGTSGFGTDVYTCPNGCSNGACISGTNTTTPGYIIQGSDSSVIVPVNYNGAGTQCVIAGLSTNCTGTAVFSGSDSIGTCVIGNTGYNVFSKAYCPDTSQACTDSDGGKDYYAKGFVTLKNDSLKNGTDSRYDDFCEGPVLWEYSCQKNIVTTDAYTCPNGCNDGACASKPIPVDKCSLKPDAGLCKAYIPKYYYDQPAGQCKEFIWGGCGGTVPFDTLKECQSSCEATCGNNICEAGEATIGPTSKCEIDSTGQRRCYVVDGIPGTCPSDCDNKVNLGEKFTLKSGGSSVFISDYDNMELKMTGMAYPTCKPDGVCGDTIYFVQASKLSCSGQVCSASAAYLQFSKTSASQQAFGAAVEMLEEAGNGGVFAVTVNTGGGSGPGVIKAPSSFDMKVGGSVIVANYNSMKIALDSFISVACVKAPCPEGGTHAMITVEGCPPGEDFCLTLERYSLSEGETAEAEDLRITFNGLTAAGNGKFYVDIRSKPTQRAQLYTDKIQYTSGETVRITVISPEVPSNAVVYKPDGSSVQVPLRFTTEVREPGSSVSAHAVFADTSLPGDYKVTLETNLQYDPAKFSVIDSRLLGKYLILRDIGEYKFATAGVNNQRMGEVNAAVYQATYKGQGRAEALVAQVDSREDAEKIIQSLKKSAVGAREERLNGNRVLVFDINGVHATLWTYRNLVVGVAEYSGGFTESTVIDDTQTTATPTAAATQTSATVLQTPQSLGTLDTRTVSKKPGDEPIELPVGPTEQPTEEPVTSLPTNVVPSKPSPPVPSTQETVVSAYLVKYPSDLGKSNDKEVSTEELLDVAFRLENLKKKFTQLQRDSNALSEYYVSIGDQEGAAKFKRISDMFGTAKTKVDKIMADIRNNIDDPDLALENVKEGMKELRSYLREILLVILGTGGSETSGAQSEFLGGI